ncbi:MAG: thiamine phosphate synthase [Deltaproteobacteria bacterium]
MAEVKIAGPDRKDKAKAPDVCLVTDRMILNGRPLADAVRDALAGGIKAVQLREKDLSARELLRLARDLRELTDEYGALLFVNDRLDIARLSNADGVHLGQQGVPAKEARRFLGKDFLIWVSTHGIDEAVEAEDMGADAITFGPVYFTESKARYGEPLGIEALRSAAKCVKIPVYAIGGINKSRVKDVISAGAQGVCLISAVLGASDMAKEALGIERAVHDAKGIFSARQT